MPFHALQPREGQRAFGACVATRPVAKHMIARALQRGQMGHDVGIEWLHKKSMHQRARRERITYQCNALPFLGRGCVRRFLKAHRPWGRGAEQGRQLIERRTG